ncbi:MAG TPA: hypothetical protein DCR93_35290, partial [Cytophagales bacterium]|nr:hypothetical protein [Cytophagales bacterium]
MRKVLLGILLFTCCGFSGDIDSLKISLQYQEASEDRIQTLFLLGRQQVVLPDTSALSTLREGLSIAKEIDDPIYEGKFRYLLGHYFHYKNHYSDAFVSFSMAEQFSMDAGDIEYATKAGIYLAWYAMETGDVDYAEAKYQSLVGTLLKEGLLSNVGFVYENLGYLYQDQESYSLAAENFKLAFTYYSQTDQMSLATKAAYSVTENLLFNLEIAEAEIYLDKAINILPTLSDSALHSVRINCFRGHVAELKGDLENAAFWYDVSSKEGIKNFSGWQDNFRRTNHIARFYLKQSALNEASEILAAQAQYITESPHNPALTTLELLAQTQEMMGDYPAALATERRYRAGVVAAQTAELNAVKAKQASEVALAKLRLEMQENERAFHANQSQWLLG